jgi:predicted  nucleic acid-binding Zn-ribbon protein
LEQTLQLLIQLQEIDFRLIALEKMKGSLPAEVTKLKVFMEQKSTQLKAAEVKLEQTQSNKRRYELELKSLEDQLTRYKEQIYQVKTNKEYDAITAEVETTEIEISDLETQLIELLDSEDELQPQIATAAKEFAEIKNQVIQKENELKTLLAQSETEVQEFTEKRIEITKLIRKTVLVSYERIQKGKNGVAVVPIENGNCTGCFTTLPPQTVMEIKQMDRLINCQYCGRFLIFLDKNPNNQ